jgi:hypothetical protein
MNISGTRPQSSGLFKALSSFSLQRGMAFGIIILIALLAFELFNYSTTEYALSDLLGDLRFAGIHWATILSIAFCGIDFAGIARLFTPDQGAKEPSEVWYLFGAWLLAATMNAILTWWGVSMAVVNHQVQSTSVMDASTVMKVVPVFVAVMVWLIRILIIGTLSYAGDRFLAQGDRPHAVNNPQPVRTLNPRPATSAPAPFANMSAPGRTAPKPVARPETGFAHPEPTYHSLSLNARSATNATNHREVVSPDPRR